MAAAVAAMVGCARPTPPPPKKTLMDVFVAEPQVMKVTRAEDFTGHTEAYRYVEIRPQVTGELTNVYFKDGENVREGALLFGIDDSIYLAQRDVAKATLEQAEARLRGYQASLDRAEESRAKGVIAKEDYDTKLADRDAGRAAVSIAAASLVQAEKNLSWTKIYARYSGRLSMRRVDPGNIVTANTTLLTTLIRLDKIYIGFDIDEQTLERRREAIRANEIASAREEKLVVEVGLSHQEGYQHKALVTFSDNQLDSGTGTLHIRAEMENPSLKLGSLPAVTGAAASLDADQKGLRLLSPNMFVRVRLPLGKAYDSLMIPEEAVGSDQGQKFVYVLNEKDEVVYRRVKLGPLEGSMRAIEERTANTPKNEGIGRNERVIVGGQQRIKPGDKVKPKPMPASGGNISVAGK